MGEFDDKLKEMIESFKAFDSEQLARDVKEAYQSSDEPEVNPSVRNSIRISKEDAERFNKELTEEIEILNRRNFHEAAKLLSQEVKDHKASDARACPFCSCLHTVVTSSIIEDGSELYHIQCWNCGGLGPATATYIDTLNAWNGQTIEMLIERGRKISREQLDKEK